MIQKIIKTKTLFDNQLTGLFRKKQPESPFQTMPKNWSQENSKTNSEHVKSGSLNVNEYPKSYNVTALGIPSRKEQNEIDEDFKKSGLTHLKELGLNWDLCLEDFVTLPKGFKLDLSNPKVKKQLSEKIKNRLKNLEVSYLYDSKDNAQMPSVFDLLASNSSSKRENFSESIKEEVLRNQNHRCAHCNNLLTVVDFDHKDNDRSNNDITNCQALCPNCHAIKTRTSRLS